MTKMFYENLYQKKREFENENICLKLTNLIWTKENLQGMKKKVQKDLYCKIKPFDFLKNRENDKSPDADGFTLSFFKNIFLFDLIYFVTRSIHISYKLGESVYYKSGIISCIPMQDKPKYLILNWRPIT